MSRVVVTGYGVKVAGAGSPSEFKDLLLEGRSGLTSTSEYSLRGESILLGLVTDPLPELLPSHHRLPRHAKLAVSASTQALYMSQLTNKGGSRVGVFVGNASGSLSELLDMYDQVNTSADVTYGKHAKTVGSVHTSAAAISSLLGVKGISRTISSGCTASLDALEDACTYISSGKIDAAVVCGVDSSLSKLVVGMFMGDFTHYAEDTHKYGSPFDDQSLGSCLAEASGTVIVESEIHALSRGAKILGVVESVNSNNEAFKVFLPDKTGKSLEMIVRQTINGITPTYINSQALGTPITDRVEEIVINTVFGGSIPVTSIKGHIGHAHGATGVVQLIASLISIEASFIPKTVRTTGRGFDINLVKETMHTQVDSVCITLHGLGGNNSCVLLDRYK